MKRRNITLSTLLSILVLFWCIPYVQATAAEASIQFEESGAYSNSEGVEISGTTTTVTTSGNYRITGSCSQGKIVVECNGKVTLLLDNLTLTSADGPVLDIRDAKEVTIYLVTGSQNTLTDAAQYTGGTDGQDAAIFSKADLIINGEGALVVHGQYADGIASRDTLTIESGDITVSAKSHGIKGKDYLIVAGGTVSISAGGDGIKATNTDQTALGYVQIKAGILSIQAEDDGISAASQVIINGGTIHIDTANNGIKSEGELTISAGSVYIATDDDSFVSQTENISDAADITIEKR